MGIAEARQEFHYAPGPVGRWLDRHFPRRGLANRQAALQSYLFDRAAGTRGFQRSVAAFAGSYDLLGGDRTRKGYLRNLTGTGDVHLTEQALSDIREVARDASRNDPVVGGLLETYAEGIIGTDLPIQARSADEGWNQAREASWRETMVQRTCDITGRFTFPHLMFLATLSYARDGDDFLIDRPEGLWLAEGEQCGSPAGLKINAETFEVTNGVATEKTTGRVIGYYLGKPDKWGYIQASSYARYVAEEVHQVYDPDRVSYTRGAPLLTAAVQWFDKFSRYADAELVSSCVQACQGVAVKSKSPTSLLPKPVTPKSNSEVNAEDKLNRYVMAPGMVWELDPDEDVANIGATRPTTVFGEFMNRVLTIAGRSAGMPLMLITQDLSGATFMNSRVAAQMAQERWRKVQAYVVAPAASWCYLRRTARDLETDRSLRPAPPDWYRHDVMCRRWPYVQPEQEAAADKLNLENGTDTRTAIVSRRGGDYRELVRQRVRELQIEKEEGLQAAETTNG